MLELILWLCLQDGKDYIPLTADADVSQVTPDPRSPSDRPQSRELLDVQLHYDSPPALGSVSWLFIPSWFNKGRTLICFLISPVQRVAAGWGLQSAPQHQDVWTHPRGKKQHHGALVCNIGLNQPKACHGQWIRTYWPPLQRYKSFIASSAGGAHRHWYVLLSGG